ncbi:MAG TPA: DinB family protein [Acidobacteriaceae bacterium]
MASVTEFKITEAVAILTRTPDTLSSLLRGLPSIWVHSNEGEDTWSALDILGHLVYAEHTDFMPRVRILLDHGETQPFDPFDRFAHLNGNPASLDHLLDEFAHLRQQNLTALAALNLQQ